MNRSEFKTVRRQIGLPRNSPQIIWEVILRRSEGRHLRGEDVRQLPDTRIELRSDRHWIEGLALTLNAARLEIGNKLIQQLSGVAGAGTADTRGTQHLGESGWLAVLGCLRRGTGESVAGQLVGERGLETVARKSVDRG
jgi:hypothetical protein